MTLALAVAMALTPWVTWGGADVCDLEHDALFGVIIDVAVDERGDVYALDEQLNTVHVFRSESRKLITIGRKGEGPGEFWAPRSIAVNGRGEFTVFQGFHAPAVAFDTSGRPTEAPRVDGLRSGWTGTDFVRVARLADGRHVAALMRVRPDAESGDGGTVGHRELVEFSGSGVVLSTLLSTRRVEGHETVGSPDAARTALYDSWDVSDHGELVFVDGDQPGTVTTVTLDERVVQQHVLHIDADVLEATTELEHAHGLAENTLPRISFVTWLEPGRSLVVQYLVSKYAEETGFTREEYWIHDLVGGTRRRIVVAHGATEHDLVLLRGGHVVVVEGARAAREEYYENIRRRLGKDTRGESEARSRPGSESTCIQVHDLRGARGSAER